MKTASGAMQAHIAQDSMSLATLWKVARTDGVTLCFTDHDQNIQYGDDVLVPITNAGFETDILTPDAALNDLAFGWTPSAAYGANAWGAYYPIVANGGFLAPDGNNVLNIAGDGASDIEIKQTLSEKWLPSTAYNISFKILTQNFMGVAGIATFRLYAGATKLYDSGLITESTPGAHTETLTYTTPALGDMIGQPITVAFYAANADLIANTLNVDSLQITRIATYLAATGFVRTAVAAAGDLSASNSEVDVILDSSAITDTDIRKGLYDYATVEVRIVNWADLSMGEIKMITGKLGHVQSRDVMAKAELRCLLQLLTPHIQKQYSPTCRAVLGDAQCTINIEALKQLVTVSSKTDDATFLTTLVRPDTWARDGKIKWLTGNNAGLTMEVKSSDPSGNLVLYMPMGFPVQPGDVAFVYPGCDRALLGSIDVEAKKFATAVSAVTDNQSFRVSPSPAASFSVDGKLVWRTGSNATEIEYVGTQDGSGNITLYKAAPNTIHVGDTLYLYPSAVGLTGDCLNKFNNVINFRGEPWVPGLDSILLYPNVH